MGRETHYGVLAAIFILLSTTGFSQAFQSISRCTDGNTMEIYMVINDTGNVSRISQDVVPCPYGCVENIGRYGADCLNPPQAMPLEFYLIILGLAFSLLILGVMRQRWLLCLSSTVFFSYLAFQSFNITIMTQSYYLPAITMLSWFAMILGTIWTLIGMVAQIKEHNKEARGEK